MKTSRTFLLFLVVAALGGWIWLHERHQLSRDEINEQLRKAFDPHIEQLTRVGIRRGDYAVELQRTGDNWFLKEPRGTPAHTPTVKQLLFRLRSLDRGELITPADMREVGRTLADFGLVVPRVILTLGTEQGVREYRIGDVNPLGNAVYVKDGDSQNVMLVSTDLLEILPEDPKQFRDRSLVPLEERDITALVLSGPEGILRLERRDITWAFAEPATANADDTLVNQVISLLLQARIEDFVSAPETGLETGLGSTPASIRIHTRGREIPYEITLGGPVQGAPGFSYARIGGQDGLLIVSSGVRQLALTEADALRDRRVLPVEPEGIQEIRVDAGEQKLGLRRTANEWALTSPLDRPASGVRVGRMLERWRDARVEAFLPANPEAKTLATVTFRADSSPAGIPMSFEVLAGEAPAGRAWVRPLGGSEIWQVVPDLLRYSPADPLPYLSREMLTFDPARVIRVTLRTGNQTSVVVRASATAPWTSPDPTLVPDPARVDEVLRLASSLSAEDLVAVNPVSLEPYGLSAPTGSVSFGLDGEQPGNRTLLFHEGPEKISAIVQGESLVFRPFREHYQVLTAVWLLPAPPVSPETENAPPANGTL